MTDVERLIVLEIALKYLGLALGDEGVQDMGLGLLPSKKFDELEQERRELIKKLA